MSIDEVRFEKGELVRIEGRYNDKTVTDALIEIVKGDIKDPNLPVHLMATFPFFDAMVRLYESDEEFKKQVDEIKASL